MACRSYNLLPSIDLESLSTVEPKLIYTNISAILVVEAHPSQEENKNTQSVLLDNLVWTTLNPSVTPVSCDVDMNVKEFRLVMDKDTKQTNAFIWINHKSQAKTCSVSIRVEA